MQSTGRRVEVWCFTCRLGTVAILGLTQGHFSRSVEDGEEYPSRWTGDHGKARHQENCQSKISTFYFDCVRSNFYCVMFL